MSYKPWLPDGEPVAVYLNRLHGQPAASEYLERDPASANINLLNYLNSRTLNVTDLRSTQAVASQLANHLALASDERALLALTFNSAVEARGRGADSARPIDLIEPLVELDASIRD